MDSFIATNIVTTTLEIHLFGGLHIALNGTPVSGFISAKSPALLAYLAYKQQPCLRDELAALLWGEMPEADAKNNLRQVLSNLRKLVRAHLLITRSNAALNMAAPFFLDTAEFEQCALNCADPEELETAVTLYRGDFMAGLPLRDAPRFEEWMLAQRARYREIAMHAWHHLTEHYLRRRAYGRAIDSAKRLLELDSWREEAYRQLMHALFYSGQRAAALTCYQNCRRILAEELGVPPSGETALLYERIRAAGQRPRHNLPAPATPFIGREPDLAQIEAWLATEEERLLTIIGLGGAGKTRLALHAARAHTADFLEGVWFVPLASVPVGSSPATAIAAAVGCQLAGTGRLEAQLLDYLDGKEMLLILDNMEHLLSRHNLIFLADLLRRAPGVRLLVTSRERLNLGAERMLKVAGLRHATGGDSPAAQLFIERARRVHPDFDPAGQEATLVRLCRLMNGLPLALELAASWIRALNMAGIAAEIERGLGFLAADWPDLPERQRSLPAVFEYSWQLLSPQEQDAYAQLSVFRSGFTAEAARETADIPLRLLTGLADKSLLRWDSDGRYRCHPLLHRFANAKLAATPDLLAAAKQAHARYYGRFARELSPAIFGGQVADALARARPELDNLRLAWETAVTNRETAVLNDLADPFMQIFDLSGLYREALVMAQQAIAALDDHTDLAQADKALALGRAYGLSAAFRFRLGAFEPAMRDGEAALRLIAPFCPHVAYGHTLAYLGAAAYGLGNCPQAVAFWQKALSAYREANSTWGECAAQTNLAEAMLTLENTVAAKQYAAAAHALARQMDNVELTAVSLQILSITAMQENDLAQAAVLGEEAVALHRQIGNQAHEANGLANLARIAAAQEAHDRALTYMQESVTTLRRLGNRLYLDYQLINLSRLALAAGEMALAETAVREALSRLPADGDSRATLAALLALAQVRQAQERWRDALRLAAFVDSRTAAPPETRAAAIACQEAAAHHLPDEEVTAVTDEAAGMDMTAVLSVSTTILSTSYRTSPEMNENS